MPRYLDEPFALERLQIEAVQQTLRRLARHDRCSLPQRQRAIMARMVLRLTKIRRELEREPERISQERARDDRQEG